MANRRVHKGSMMLECGLTLPVLFLLIMGVLQFAQIWTARQVVAYAAYCAARTTLSYSPYEHDPKLAGRSSTAYLAAKRVCAWINLAGMAETLENGSGRSTSGEVYVPGWGYVPESNSVDRRLKVSVDNTSTTYSSSGVTAATVTYRFPLVMPVAGQMISWLVKHDIDDEENAAVEFNPISGWTGEAEVLDDERKYIARQGKDGDVKMDWMEKGVFPYIELKETCCLPMSYSTRNFPVSSEALMSRLQEGGLD